jgi:hypothetical protein
VDGFQIVVALKGAVTAPAFAPTYRVGGVRLSRSSVTA